MANRKEEVRDRILLGTDFTHEIEVSGVDGVITVHRPSILEEIKASVKRDDILHKIANELGLVAEPDKDGNVIDPINRLPLDVFMYAQQIGTLEVVIDSAPKGLKESLRNIPGEVVRDIFDDYDAWLSSFRYPGRGDNEESNTGLVPEEPVETK